MVVEAFGGRQEMMRRCCSIKIFIPLCIVSARAASVTSWWPPPAPRLGSQITTTISFSLSGGACTPTERDIIGVTTRTVRSCTTQTNITETYGSANQVAAMNFSLALRSGRKVRATFMEEEARMGIPNRAHRRRHGQESQSRCKLAMPFLAI
jgi:hypothetical protein